MSKSFAFVSFLFSLLMASTIAAQDPPSAARSSTGLAVPPSLSHLKVGDVFVAKEGRFSLLLPKESLTSFSPFEVGNPQSGGTYEWELKEGRLALQFFDKPDAAAFTTEQRQQMLADGLAGALANAGGTRISEEPSNLGSVTGRKIKLAIPGNQVLLGRAFSDRTRLYVLVPQPNSSLEGAEPLITKALDSFKVTDDSRSQSQE